MDTTCPAPTNTTSSSDSIEKRLDEFIVLIRPIRDKLLDDLQHIEDLRRAERILMEALMEVRDYALHADIDDKFTNQLISIVDDALSDWSMSGKK